MSDTSTNTQEDLDAPRELGRARRRHGVAAAGVGLGAAVVVAVVMVTSGGGGSDEHSTDSPSVSTATTKITRQDLVETDDEDGTLGYADTRDVVNHLTGVVTWIATQGAVVHPNHTIYRVDGAPVVLLDGTSPAYRTLSPSSSRGHDIAQLERNLRRLGYDSGHDMTVDGSWDSGTTAAARRWQDDHGLDETGSVELGQIVFLPGARRIASVDATLGGSSAGGGASNVAETGSGATSTANGIMTTTSTRKIVTVDLATTKSSLAIQGAKVDVALPSGTSVSGRIASIGKVATAETNSDGSSTGTATIAIIIRLNGKASTLDQAPVTVSFEQRRIKDVLAIPVTALLAQAGGKFAVELIDGTARRLVPVTPGVYTSGFVQVTGDGLRAGQTATNAAVR